MVGRGEKVSCHHCGRRYYTLGEHYPQCPHCQTHLHSCPYTPDELLAFQPSPSFKWQGQRTATGGTLR